MLTKLDKEVQEALDKAAIEGIRSITIEENEGQGDCYFTVRTCGKRKITVGVNDLGFWLRE